ncbi:MAG TPA: hypothetical protein VHB77_21130, partial [Planctomycetaceae bacterium]|nr:hypothetical protein [Planctomycetaceae bacterium]
MSTERTIRRRWSRAGWPALGLLLAGFGIACFLEPAETGGFRPSASSLFAAEEEAPPAKGGESADEPKSDDSDGRAESPTPQAKPGTVNRAQFALRSQARRRPTGGSSDKSLLQLDCYYDVGSPQGGLLVRELYRQALLIAARDELHMRTRDR